MQSARQAHGSSSIFIPLSQPNSTPSAFPHSSAFPFWGKTANTPFNYKSRDIHGIFAGLACPDNLLKDFRPVRGKAKKRAKIEIYTYIQCGLARDSVTEIAMIYGREIESQPDGGPLHKRL